MSIRGANEVFLDASMGDTVQLSRSIDRFLEAFKQSLLALSFILGTLFAGYLFVTYSSVFSSAVWVLILYPSILSMRGVISGLFSGRLSTGLHLGTVKPSFTENTRSFHALLYAVITLTLQSSLMIGGTVSLISVFLWGAPFLDAVRILSVVIATMGLSLLFVSPVALAASVIAFSYGLDPDVVVYPVMSTFADVADTLCFILAVELLFSLGPFGPYLIGVLDSAFILLVLYILAKYGKEREFAVTLKEFFLALVAVTFIVNITGSVLGKIGQVIGSRPKVYFVYPALISTVGAVGSIVGSTATTKLALGTVKSSFAEVKRNIPEISGTCAASGTLFVFFAVLSSFFTHEVIVFNELLELIAVLLTLNLLAAPLVSVVAYGVAVLTYKRGLNPDNFVIPFESSLSDSVTTVCLLIVLSLFGWVSLTA
ncbi:MAG: magnesium transporter [Candidatus Bathyarchaeota archaeon]|nr:magnesium transporter [Candidatus Bathyarchaeota archaeon]